MSQPHPDETAAALPASQKQLDQTSEAEIQARKRSALALLRQWMTEDDEEDEKMWPLVEEEFNCAHGVVSELEALARYERRNPPLLS